MAASEVVEVYIQEYLRHENLRSEAATKSLSGKRYSQNVGKIPGKCQRKSPFFSKAASSTKNEPSHSHPPRILL